MEFQIAITEYIATLERRRRSTHTTVKYRQILKDFHQLIDLPTIADLREEHAQHYTDLRTDLSDHSLHIHLGTLKRFSKWAARRHLISSDVFAEVELPDYEVPPPVTFSAEQLEALLAYSPQNHTPYVRIRNATVFAIMGLAGLRINECLNLRLGNITQTAISVRFGSKRKKTRAVPTLPRLWRAVQTYTPALHWLLCRAPQPDDLLFPGQSGDAPVSDWYFNEYLKPIVNAIGAPGATTHSFRHTYATLLFENGTDIYTIQKLLGHARIETTINYIKMSTANTVAGAMRHPLAA